MPKCLEVGISLSSLPVNSLGVWVQSSPRWVEAFNLFSLPNPTVLDDEDPDPFFQGS